MIPLIRRVIHALLTDELLVRRWLRAWLGAFATGGMGFADQLAAATGGAISGEAIRVLSVIAGFIALAINLGDKNPPPREGGANE